MMVQAMQFRFEQEGSISAILPSRLYRDLHCLCPLSLVVQSVFLQTHPLEIVLCLQAQGSFVAAPEINLG
jgi:hypothetical protein